MINAAPTADATETANTSCNIPEELKNVRQWVARIPNSKRGMKGWNTRENWRTYDEVVSDGKAPIFVTADNYVAFDFDNVVGPDGEIPEYVRKIVESVDSYTEYSQSGNGLHIVARVSVEESKFQSIRAGSKTHKDSGFEFHPRNQPLFVTGDVFEFRETIREATTEVRDVLNPFFEGDGAEIYTGRLHWSEGRPDLTLEMILSRAEAYVMKMDPAVEKRGGSTQVMKVCCALTHGFGLDEYEAWDILQEYNREKCFPSFDEWKDHGPDSLRRKLLETYKKTDHKHPPLGLLQKIPNGHRFSGKTMSEIWHLADEPVDWLVEGVLSADQPTIFGAKSKSLKTTVLMDFAVASATGGSWLGVFKIPKRRRVLFITGETNDRAASRRARKATQAPGRLLLSPHDLGDWLRIESMAFPKLPREEDCDQVSRIVQDYGIDVVILDPLYRGLTGDVDSRNVFDMGGALGGFMAACRPASVIISHHLKKYSSAGTVPDLEDLSGSGLAEFAGNFWLMKRVGEYQNNQQHQLAVSYGGRDEQSGAFALSFDERAWRFEKSPLVSPASLKEVQAEQKTNNFEMRILEALEGHPNGLSRSKLAEECGTKPDRKYFCEAMNNLETAENICQVDGFTSGNKECEGWRLVNREMEGVGTDTCPDTD
ncbi:MAG: hypothetical protein Fues2KO_24210 [Fuerstiella sp.]